MPNNKTASSEAHRIRRREAAQNRMTRAIIFVCGIVTAACLWRYHACGSQTSARTVFCLAGAALYLLSFSSLASGSWTIGMFPPAVAGAFAVCLSAFADIVFGRSGDLPVWLLRAALIAAGLFSALFAVYFAAMLAGGRTEFDDPIGR